MHTFCEWQYRKNSCAWTFVYQLNSLFFKTNFWKLAQNLKNSRNFFLQKFLQLKKTNKSWLQKMDLLLLTSIVKQSWLRHIFSVINKSEKIFITFQWNFHFKELNQNWQQKQLFEHSKNWNNSSATIQLK